MGVCLDRLAELVGGRVSGDPAIEIHGATTLACARPGEITLVDRPDKLVKLAANAATAVVIGPDIELPARPAIVVADVHAAFAAIVSHFRPPRASNPRAVSPLAIIAPTARLANDVGVEAGATIGEDVEIGAGSTIHAGARILAGCRLAEQVTIHSNAVLHEGTLVGSRVVIHACAVIGSDGFGYQLVEGRHRLSAQLGHVEIGADVEIGACTTIDRGTYGPTAIGEGTKIDNLVMIAHNCRIGRHNLICSQVGIAGSTVTGDYVVMAGQVGVRDHVQIGEKAILGAQCGVANDVPADTTVLGSPATPVREQKLMMAAYAKLPEMRRQLRAVEKAIRELERIVSDRASREAEGGDRERNAA